MAPPFTHDIPDFIKDIPHPFPQVSNLVCKKITEKLSSSSHK